MVGCGGTGSFLALHLARLAYHARERHHLAVQLVFVDPDVVELKNVGRQNFCPAEVGANKAQALMLRYNRAFGLESRAYAQPADHELMDALVSEWRGTLSYDERGRSVHLLCGCVDNAAARCEMHRAAKFADRPWWWLDGGNHEHAGQVLLGNRVDIQTPEISPLKVCVGLPAPSIQCPDLLITSPLLGERLGEGSEEGVSCADLALLDVQGLMVNQAVAGWMAVYASRLLLSHDLDIYATYLDQVTGSVQSKAIVE